MTEDGEQKHVTKDSQVSYRADVSIIDVLFWGLSAEKNCFFVLETNPEK